jgi:hypothetical protein
MSANVLKQMRAYYTNDASYTTRENLVRQIGVLFSITPFTTIGLTLSKIVDKIAAVTSSNNKKNMLIMIIKVAEWENNLTLINSREFVKYRQSIIAENFETRINSVVADKIDIGWYDVKNVYDNISANPDDYEFNVRLIATMIYTMPVLRTGEYISIQLSDTGANNYLNKLTWSIILRNQKSPTVGMRTIPISKEVKKLISGKLRNQTYMFETSSKKHYHNSSFGLIISNLYGEHVNLMGLRVLSSSYYATIMNPTERTLLAKQMGHTIDTHMVDYECDKI